MPPVYTRIHQAGKPAVANMSVNTNPDISATCTVPADGNILPLYFIYPESQINHATGNSVNKQKQAHITVTGDHNDQVNCHN